MQDLIDRIRERLAAGAYINEASVSHGILMPLLQRLGWDGSDPGQVIPEFSSGRGRVDFALCSTPGRPAIFVEVKGVGRSVEGDRQLFEYAFHEGVPICLLTDGRDWSFYLPSGQGSYDDRRLYRLQIDDRSSDEIEQILVRYLARDRVRSGAAAEDATRDYRNASAKRDAARSLPQAWRELVSEGQDLLTELVADKAEALCGFRPPNEAVSEFLRSLTEAPSAQSIPKRTEPGKPSASVAVPKAAAIQSSTGLSYRIFGEDRTASNASRAFLDALKTIVRRAPEKLPELAAAARGRSRNHIARTVEEIYPARPDLARAEEIAAGWLVGLNIANREKARILQAAIDVFGLTRGRDIEIKFPNE
ncbi:MAG: hypothetical protein V4720_04140 [Pseudomonadota bacterium]